MSARYEDALQQVLEALQQGESFDTAVAPFQENAGALREDARIVERVAELRGAVPAPGPEARAAASRRLHGQLAAQRQTAAPGWSFGRFGWARYVAAAAVVAIALLGAGLVLRDGGGTVEASTIEGVVVDNQEGMLTVQTLDALEQVEVPADVLVSDVEGASLQLSGIEAGQVVVVDLERRSGEAVAQRVQRFVDSVEAWCADESERCRTLSAGLERAEEHCLEAPMVCRFTIEHLEELRLRAGEAISLEELKAGCRGGEAGACRDIVQFCEEELQVCGAGRPEMPSEEHPLIGNLVSALRESCQAGDETACRQLERACERLENLCAREDPERQDRPSPAGPP